MKYATHSLRHAKHAEYKKYAYEKIQKYAYCSTAYIFKKFAEKNA